MHRFNEYNIDDFFVKRMFRFQLYITKRIRLMTQIRVRMAREQY